MISSADTSVPLTPVIRAFSVLRLSWTATSLPMSLSTEARMTLGRSATLRASSRVACHSTESIPGGFAFSSSVNNSRAASKSRLSSASAMASRSTSACCVGGGSTFTGGSATRVTFTGSGGFASSLDATAAFFRRSSSFAICFATSPSSGVPCASCRTFSNRIEAPMVLSGWSLA